MWINAITSIGLSSIYKHVQICMKKHNIDAKPQFVLYSYMGSYHIMMSLCYNYLIQHIFKLWLVKDHFTFSFSHASPWYSPHDEKACRECHGEVCENEKVIAFNHIALINFSNLHNCINFNFSKSSQKTMAKAKMKMM